MPDNTNDVSIEKDGRGNFVAVKVQFENSENASVVKDDNGIVIAAISRGVSYAAAVDRGLKCLQRKLHEVAVRPLQTERRGVISKILGAREAHVQIQVLPDVLKNEESARRAARDRTLDRVVNCGFCFGSGELIEGQLVLDYNPHERDYYCEPELLSHECRDLSLNGVTHRVKFGRRIYQRVDCPLCRKTGRAFGLYSTESCSGCEGRGFLLKTIRKRQQVGTVEVQIQENCQQCAGSGSVETLFFRTLNQPGEGHIERIPSDVRAVPQHQGEYCIVLTSENRDLLRISEPRKF